MATGLLPSLLYNGGRVVSYTVIGGVVGGAGIPVQPLHDPQGRDAVVAGAFMLFLGRADARYLPLALAAEDPHSPASGRDGRGLPPPAGDRSCRAAERAHALRAAADHAGLRAGDGELASPARLSMFLFSLGTVPLLLGFGAVSALLSAKFNRRHAARRAACSSLVARPGHVHPGPRACSGSPCRDGPVAAQARAAGPGRPAAACPAARPSPACRGRPGGARPGARDVVPAVRRAGGCSRPVDHRGEGRGPQRVQQRAHRARSTGSGSGWCPGRTSSSSPRCGRAPSPTPAGWG